MAQSQENGEREREQADLAPETHNAEQDDHLEQAQEITKEARDTSHAGPGPTESEKVGDSGLMDDSTQDTIDLMRGMEQSGLIDEHAYDGEPNHDDNVDKYGDQAKVDDLRGDGT